MKKSFITLGPGCSEQCSIMQLIFFGFVIRWLICLEISGDMSNNVTM